MLNGPMLMLPELDHNTEENLGGLYLDLHKVSAYWPRRRVDGVNYPECHKSIGPYFGTWVACDGRVYCTVYSCTDLYDEMIEAQKQWELRQKNSSRPV